MKQKKLLTGLLILLSTVLLAAFYWLTFFPSQYWMQGGLMGGIWLVQAISLFYWVKWTTATTIEGRGLLWWVLAGLLVLLSLLYGIGSATPDPNRELVKAFVVEGKQLELYHLDRHDHTAVEIFVGPEGGLAQRYVRDHFTIKETEQVHNFVYIHNSLQAEELRLNLTTLAITLQAGH